MRRAAWNHRLASRSTQTLRIPRNNVQEDLQYPTMRNSSPLALYFATMGSKSAKGPPPPIPVELPAAIATDAETSSETATANAFIISSPLADLLVVPFSELSQ